MNTQVMYNIIDTNKIVSTVFKAIQESYRPTPVKSKHDCACKVCGAHPVNHVGREKITCRQCGASHSGDSVRFRSGDYYAGEVLLDLRRSL